MVFKPNHIKNFAVAGIILLLPIFITLLLPELDPRILFGLPTALLVLFLLKMRSKLQYEIENNQLILISSKDRHVIPIRDIREIHLHQSKILPVTQYFVVTSDEQKYEVAEDLLNGKGETVIDVLIETYGIDVEKKGSVKFIVKR